MSDTFKFDAARVSPLSRVEVEDSQSSQKTPTSVAAAPVEHLTDIDLDLQQFCKEGNPRATRLMWLANVLDLPAFAGSLYSETKNGWSILTKSTGVRVNLTFDDVDALINARCDELNVDRSLVEARGTSRHSLAETQAFYRMSLNERIQRFKKSETRS